MGHFSRQLPLPRLGIARACAAGTDAWGRGLLGGPVGSAGSSLRKAGAV